MSAQCADVVFPIGKTTGRRSRPLALPMGELASEARLRGRRQWQVWVNAVIATGYPLSHGFQPCQLSQRESQGAGCARRLHRNLRSVICRHPATQSPPATPDTYHHPYPCITCINIPPHPQVTTPHPSSNHPGCPPQPRSLPQATPPDPRKPRFPFALFCPGIAISCGKAPWFSKKMVHNKILQNATNRSAFVHFLQILRGHFIA